MSGSKRGQARDSSPKMIGIFPERRAAATEKKERLLSALEKIGSSMSMIFKLHGDWNCRC